MHRALLDFLTFLGITNGLGRWYLYHSGFGANFAIYAAMVVFYRKHNCHIHRCWRLSKHTSMDAQGVEHAVCKHHHPDLGKKHRLLPHMLGF